MSLSCAYHPLGDTKVIEEEEYKKLLATGVWFDNPRTAWEYKYLLMPEYNEWPIKEGAHFLVGENPDNPPPRETEKYQMIMKSIENDFIRGKLRLVERVNFKGDKIYFISNVELIHWAIERGFDIPKCCDGYKQPKKKLQSSTPSLLGKKGSRISNKRHHDAKVIAQTIAQDAWDNSPDKTKEDIAALVLANFQENKIFNAGEPYSSSTICGWIKCVMPIDKIKGGRPRKNKTQY